MVKVFFKRAAHLLTAFFAGGVCVLQAAETSGFGIDLGNGSGAAQEGWTNVTMPATASGGANTFVAVPLIRNGAASSSSSVAVGSLFGRLVSLTVSARCSSGGSYTLAEPNTRYTWYEGGKHRHNGTNADAPSSFEFPNGCEAFNTSMRLSANGMPSASAAARLSFSGFQAGKEYTVSFFCGHNAPAYESMTLVSGTLVDVRGLQSSMGSLSGNQFSGLSNSSEQDAYLAVEWKACADEQGRLVFDVTKEADSSASGRMELNAVTVSTDDSPAPEVPEPRPVSVLHNKALIFLPSSLALPVPSSTWAAEGQLTCEFWVRPNDDAVTGKIISLGNASVYLEHGCLALSAPDGDSVASVKAAGKELAAGEWHHVAVSVGEEVISLYVDGGLAVSSPRSPYLQAMKSGWKGIVLEGGVKGALDELRFWNAALGGKEDDFFLNGPLPLSHPRYGRLVGCWRLDGDFRDAKWTEFAEKTGSAFVRPYQAVAPEGTEFSIVTDNETFRYMLVTAYVRNVHVIYDWPARAHLINNSDLIYINSVTPAANGSLNFQYPDNDVTESSGVVLLPSDGECSNVLDFSGEGAYMNVGGGLLGGGSSGAFTVEVRMALDGDGQEAVLFENDNVSMRLEWKEDHYRVRTQAGPDKAWEADLPPVEAGRYFWLAFVRNSSADTASFYVDGEAVSTAAADAGEMEGTANAVIGRNLDGRIDEMRVWHEARAAARLGAAVQHSWGDRLLVGRWGTSDQFGHDTASWVEHVRILRRLTEGVSGMRIRLGVSGGNWSAMLSDANARKAFAENVAEVVRKHQLDGLDLDFEWIDQNDTAAWNNYGELARAIREASPDMFFTISLHTYYYKFPASCMRYVDYFTFQNYGPQIDVNGYSSMVSACGTYRSWGYPDSKIMLSAPFQGTPGAGQGADIRAYRDIVSACAGVREDPSLDSASFNYGGGKVKTLHFNGVDTVRKKARYISEQQVAGFMYWDLGMDVADSAGKNNYFDECCLLRAANRYVSSTAYPDTPAPFALSSAGETVPAGGGAVAVEVQSEEKALGWVVADCPEWISASAVSGIGRTTVILTAAENKSADGRSGTVIFRSSDKQECSVIITQDGAELTGYDKWVQDSFPPDAAADRTAADAVPAGDGIPNLMKYATGQDPLKPCGSVTKVTLEEGEDGCLHLVLRWPVNPQATDVKHEVEASTDLVDWISLGEVETAGKTAAEFWDAEPERESGMERRFLRLKVTRE